MKRSEKVLLSILSLVSIGLISFLSGVGVCDAAEFPDRPITVIVNYGAGGSADTAVRLIGKVAEKKLGVPLVVQNRSGGGGTVGVAELARQKPDGYTIGTPTMGPMVVYPIMQEVPYDPYKDFDYIAGFGRYLYPIFVLKNSPYKSVKDIVEAARKNPGKLTYGSASLAVAIGWKYVELKENIKMGYVKLQSGSEVATSLLGKHIDISVGGDLEQFVETGEARVLAVCTAERMPAFPNAPTMKELGYDIDTSSWMALGAPAGVPKDRLNLIYEAWKAGSEDPEVKQTLQKLQIWTPIINGEEIVKIYKQRSIDFKPLLDALLAEQVKK